jgi:hypothetical protein
MSDDDGQTQRRVGSKEERKRQGERAAETCPKLELTTLFFA